MEGIRNSKNAPWGSLSDSLLSTPSRTPGSNEGVDCGYRQVPLFLPLPLLPTKGPHTFSSPSVGTTILENNAAGESKARRALFSLSGVTGGMKETLGRLAAGREGRERPSSFPVNTIPEVSENKREH